MPSILYFTLVAFTLAFGMTVKADSCPQNALCLPGSSYPYACGAGYIVDGGFSQPTSICTRCPSKPPYNLRCNPCITTRGVNDCSITWIPIHCYPAWGLTGAARKTYCVDCALTPGSWSDGSAPCAPCTAGLTCDPISGVATSCGKKLVLYQGTCIDCKPKGRAPDPRCLV